MNCHTTRAWLVDYTDGALDPKRRDRTEAHLSQCPTCARLAREAVETRRMLRGLPPLQTSAQFEARLSERLASSRRPAAAGSRWVRLIPPRPPLLRPALAFGAALLAVTGVTLLHTHVPTAPPHGTSEDALLITQCMALHQRDVAAQPLTDSAATGIGRGGWTGDAASNASQEESL